MYKLSDFGYAKEAESNKLQSIVGTLPYAVSAGSADDVVCIVRCGQSWPFRLAAVDHVDIHTLSHAVCVFLSVSKCVGSETGLTVLADCMAHRVSLYMSLCFHACFSCLLAGPRGAEGVKRALQAKCKHYCMNMLKTC